MLWPFQQSAHREAVAAWCRAGRKVWNAAALASQGLPPRGALANGTDKHGLPDAVQYRRCALLLHASADLAADERRAADCCLRQTQQAVPECSRCWDCQPLRRPCGTQQIALRSGPPSTSPPVHRWATGQHMADQYCLAAVMPCWVM